MQSRNVRLRLMINAGCLWFIVNLLINCSPISSNPRSTLANQSKPQPQQVKPTALTKISDVPVMDVWYNMQFVDNNNCFLSTSKKLFRSTNGGQDWELIYSANSYEQTIVSAYFLDAQMGWLRTFNSWYKTEDSGHTWSLFISPLSSPQGKLREIKFVERRVGWIAGAVLRPPSKEELKSGADSKIPPYYFDDVTHQVLKPTIFRTDDGGLTWQPQLIPSDLGEINKLVFVDTEHGIALGRREAFYTKNGGRTWTKVNDPKACLNADERNIYEGNLSDAFLLDTSVGWISYDDGRLIQTSNEGRTWNEIQPCDSMERSIVMYFIDKNYGWGLSKEGFLYKTENGGVTWIKTNGNQYSHMYFLNRTNGWIISTEGLFRINIE